MHCALTRPSSVGIKYTNTILSLVLVNALVNVAHDKKEMWTPCWEIWVRLRASTCPSNELTLDWPDQKVGGARPACDPSRAFSASARPSSRSPAQSRDVHRSSRSRPVARLTRRCKPYLATTAGSAL